MTFVAPLKIAYRTYGINRLVVVPNETLVEAKTVTTWFARRRIRIGFRRLGFNIWVRVKTVTHGCQFDLVQTMWPTENDAWSACLKDYIGRNPMPVTLPGREATLP